MSKAKLSVIIPVHNRRILFLECLKSVFDQDILSEIEVVIIDDHSSLSVESYLKKTKYWKSGQIKLIRNRTVSGPAFARNQGIKNSTGKYLAFLDSDDVWKRDFASQMVSCLESSSFGIYSCMMSPRFSKGFPFKDIIFYSFLNFVRNTTFYAGYFLNKGALSINFFYMTRLSGMIFKKNEIKNACFDASYKSAEDWKFVFESMHKNKTQIGVLPKTLANFSYHKNSETFGRSDYFKYYSTLLKEIPSRYHKNFGIKMFKMYTRFCIWKDTRLSNKK